MNHSLFEYTHNFENRMFSKNTPDSSINLSHGLGFLNTPYELVKIVESELKNQNFKIYGDIGLDNIISCLTHTYLSELSGSSLSGYKAMLMHSATFSLNTIIEFIKHTSDQVEIYLFDANYYLLFQIPFKKNIPIRHIKEFPDNEQCLYRFEKILQTSDKKPILILPQPSNPKGLYIEKFYYLKLLNLIKDYNGWLILDLICASPSLNHQNVKALLNETFSGTHSIKKIFVIDSITKRRCCGGFRLSTLLLDAEYYDFFRDFQETSLFYPSVLGIKMLVFEYIFQMIDIHKNTSKVINIISNKLSKTDFTDFEKLISVRNLERSYSNYAKEIKEIERIISCNKMYFLDSIKNYCGFNLTQNAFSNSFSIYSINSIHEEDFAIDLWTNKNVWLYPFSTFGMDKSGKRNAEYRITYSLESKEFIRGVEYLVNFIQHFKL